MDGEALSRPLCVCVQVDVEETGGVGGSDGEGEGQSSSSSLQATYEALCVVDAAIRQALHEEAVR